MFLIIFINLFILNVNVRYKAMTRGPIWKLSSYYNSQTVSIQSDAGYFYSFYKVIQQWTAEVYLYQPNEAETSNFKPKTFRKPTDRRQGEKQWIHGNNLGLNANNIPNTIYVPIVSALKIEVFLKLCLFLQKDILQTRPEHLLFISILADFLFLRFDN